MLDWIKAEAGRSKREEVEESSRRISENWGKRVRREMREIVEEEGMVRMVREKGETFRREA